MNKRYYYEDDIIHAAKELLINIDYVCLRFYEPEQDAVSYALGQIAAGNIGAYVTVPIVCSGRFDGLELQRELFGLVENVTIFLNPHLRKDE